MMLVLKRTTSNSRIFPMLKFFEVRSYFPIQVNDLPSNPRFLLFHLKT
uniref:Uncharacterized protein n=1 Tax=Rhizophora mucronata TaxID=61149 RepID=A0A2P2PT17_RHIMU